MRRKNKKKNAKFNSFNLISSKMNAAIGLVGAISGAFITFALTHVAFGNVGQPVHYYSASLIAALVGAFIFLFIANLAYGVADDGKP